VLLVSWYYILNSKLVDLLFLGSVMSGCLINTKCDRTTNVAVKFLILEPLKQLLLGGHSIEASRGSCQIALGYARHGKDPSSSQLLHLVAITVFSVAVSWYPN
jgi:hypothetical protein